ncbi:lactoylglutathione lyase [Thioclava sp. SK-1]|uniref:VOC family protein n=1 Tax=Thioclava sp. SK-1 TaxID=1889770 RepID=UPI00082650AA|nr:VOC family protein [Thioclava sp. SK-1]OCX66452.1 lactoylglutathione lyase [Thioclava sp. SK-1]
MIRSLDHLVLTTVDEAACIAFYVDLLGMRLERFGEGRKALRFGDQKINIHVKGQEYEPKAHLPVPGALDLCFLLEVPLEDALATLRKNGAQIVDGPVLRSGATGRLRSIYLRDPDLNLVELSERVS